MNASVFDQADAIARYQALVKVEIKNRLKADDQRLARALIVADAKRSLDAGGFKAFLEKIECGESTSRELLKIAKAGTADDVRRATAFRVADHRARRKAAAAPLLHPDVTAPAPEAPLKPFATLKREVDARWREQLPENQPRPEPTPAKIAERVADAELAAFEFSYSAKDHYNKVSKQAAEIGVTLPPMKEGRGKRTIRLYLPVAMAEVIEEKLGNVNRVPVWAAKARDARKRHDPGGALKFINDAASTLKALEDWQYMLSNNGELDGDAIDDNIVAGAKAAAEAWAKLYETILRQLRTNVIPLKKKDA
jgi:hypothetical protein